MSGNRSRALRSMRAVALAAITLLILAA